MPLLPGRILLLPPLVLVLAGCTTPQPNKARLLSPTQMSPDSVALEIFLIRLPPGEPGVNARVWDEVDEQHFPAELRQRLAKNGFRVGIVGEQVPDVLAKLMELKDQPAPTGEPQRVTAKEMEATPRVALRHLQTRAGQRNEIITSGVYEHLPVLLAESGELRGQTYCQAQGMLALAVSPQADGRVQLDLVPELHHDQSRQHWVGDQAMWRLETGRPKRSFDDMKITAVLMPGSMLLLGTQPDRPGSLGHCFFAEECGRDNRWEQKMVLVRVCQTQHDDLVNPPPLALGP